MKLITFMSFKGGVGKTTALMTVASTLLERGHKIACFEADDNRPLSAWRENGIEHGTWDAQCAIYPALSIDLLSQSYEIAERDGVEFGLIDTRGGGSDLNQSILINSDLTIIPTGLSPLEVEDTLETLQYIVRLHKHYEISSAYGILVNRTDTRQQMPKVDRDGLTTIERLPHFQAQLHRRQTFSDIKKIGHLHKHYEALQKDSAKRFQRGHVLIALQEGRGLMSELLPVIGSPDVEEVAE